jgi:transposase
MKKSSENKKTSTKRRFSTLFKQQAVERADKDGVAQVAKDLGITPGLIYNWRNSLANQSSEQEEIKLMRAENARLKRELSIAQDDLAFLKKAAAYFANPQK